MTDPNCPLDIASSAIYQVLAAISDTEYLPVALERFVLEVASAHEELASPLIQTLTDIGTDSSIRMVGLITAQHQGPRAALDALKQLGGSERSCLAIAARCLAAGDHETLRQACAQAIAVASPPARGSVQQTASRLLLEAGLRADGMALLMEVFRSEPTEWACRQILKTAAPDEQREYAGRMLAILDRPPGLSLGIELYLATGNPSAAADRLARDRLQHPEQQARVAAALAPIDLDRAVRLWWDAATALIRHQSRGYYAQAAESLAAMRAALIAAGRSSEWFQRKNQLLAQYPRHRALHDEMQQAGAW